MHSGMLHVIPLVGLIPLSVGSPRVQSMAQSGWLRPNWTHLVSCFTRYNPSTAEQVSESYKVYVLFSPCA